MPWRSPDPEGELDSLHVEADRDSVVAALDADCEGLGMHRIDPASLVPYGRWFHGDEDPHVRRFLVSPTGPRWTSVLPSATDWELEMCTRVAAALGRRCAYLMLHDGDVLTLDLFEGGEVISYLSSPWHFDLPPRREGDLGMDPARIVPACRPGTTVAQVVEALTPPGRIDVDGRRAFEMTAGLLELPPRAMSSYRLALEADGLTVRPEFADHLHLAYCTTAGEDAEERAAEEAEPEIEAASPASAPASGTVLPFRRR